MLIYLNFNDLDLEVDGLSLSSGYLDDGVQYLINNHPGVCTNFNF